MRNRLLLFLLLISVGVFAQQKPSSSFIKDLPQPARAVNDFGKFLTASEKEYLENELGAYLQRSGNAIVIISLESLTDPATKKEYSVEEVALQYFNKWGIGDSAKNNGVLIFISRQPKRARITVGTGLETILTNIVCQEIIDTKLVPAFKAGLFFSGLKDAVTAIEDKLNPPPPVQQGVEAPAQPHLPVSSDFRGYSSDSNWGNYITFFVFLGIGVLIFYGVIVAIIKEQRGHYNSSGYHNHRWNNTYNNYNRNSYNSSFSSGSSSGFSSRSSSSSSSGSYGGGSASGSW